MKAEEAKTVLFNINIESTLKRSQNFGRIIALVLATVTNGPTNYLKSDVQEKSKT